MKTKVGRLLNEATAASAVAIAYSLGGKFIPATVRVAGGFLGFGMFGITGLVGGRGSCPERVKELKKKGLNISER